MSQFILQPLFLFTYVKSSSLKSPGEPPMVNRLHIRSFKYRHLNFKDCGSMVTLSREIPGSIPGADQSVFFSVFRIVTEENVG